MTFKTFIEECRKKDVLKLVSIYIVSTWVMLQVLSVTWQPLGLPEKSVTILIILLLAGFPVYLFYIWKYRLHISDDKMELLEEKKAAKKSAFKKIYFGILITASALSILTITVILKVNFFGSSEQLPKIVDASDKIAVLRFGNNTGDASFDVVGKMAADWIIHGINEKQVAQVISPETLSTYIDSNVASNSTSEKIILTKYFNPSKIISGNFFLDKGELVLQGSIQANKFSKTLISFKPQLCDSSNPLDCIENLKQLVVSYLFLENKTDDLKLQESPPKFDAYQNVIEAKASYDDPQRYISLLEQAIEQDPTYFEPKVLQVAYYYGEKEFAKADSLFRNIIPSSHKNIRQLNLLRHYEALLAGQNNKIYSTIKKEYEIAPFDLQTNSSTMVVALQFVNRPQDVAAIYEEVDMANLELEGCPFCRTRTYVKILADIQLGNYEQAIALSEPLHINYNLFIKPWLVAHIRSGNTTPLDSYINRLSLSNDDDIDILLSVAQEYSLLGNQEQVAEIANKITSLKTIEKRILLEFLYLNKEFEKLISLSNQFSDIENNNFAILSKVAVSQMKMGNAVESQKWINQLKSQRAQYQFGAIDYALAQYYSAIDDREATFDYLRKSVKSGFLFKSRTFTNDPHFVKYTNDPEFIKITQYWYDL